MYNGTKEERGSFNKLFPHSHIVRDPRSLANKMDELGTLRRTLLDCHEHNIMCFRDTLL